MTQPLTATQRVQEIVEDMFRAPRPWRLTIDFNLNAGNWSVDFHLSTLDNIQLTLEQAGLLALTLMQFFTGAEPKSLRGEMFIAGRTLADAVAKVRRLEMH